MVCLMALQSFTSACDLHTSNNGDLDGFWQLTSMDTLSTGRSGDMRSQKIFWSVQAHLLEMRDLHDVNPGMCHEPILFRFRHEGDCLYLSEPIANNRNISDSVVVNPATVRFYGLSRLDETFKVLQPLDFLRAQFSVDVCECSRKVIHQAHVLLNGVR